MITLGKFWDTKTYKDILFKNNEITTFNEYNGIERGGLNGQYHIINGILIAIFSNEGKNYILISETLYSFNTDFSIDYYCEQNPSESSRIKILNNEKVILDLKYKNDQEPFLDYIGGGAGEDWDIGNFAWHLGGYFKRIKENPKVILFPGH